MVPVTADTPASARDAAHSGHLGLPAQITVATTFVSPDPAGDPRPGNGHRLTGPVATLRATVATLLGLAGLLGAIAGSAAAALTALGVTGLVPLTLGALVRSCGRRGRDEATRRERAEDAAIVTAAAALCWQPVVLLTDLGGQIVHGGSVALAAGALAVILSIWCARP